MPCLLVVDQIICCLYQYMHACGCQVVGYTWYQLELGAYRFIFNCD